MRLFRNIGYFFREAGKVIWMNKLSTFFSFLGTVLILFIFGLVISGWRISNQFTEMLQKEAEISAYFEKDTDAQEAENIVNMIKSMGGVQDARYIDTDEAYRRMEDILGDEAYILELFEQNPFEAFIEVRIDLDQMDTILEQLKHVKGIEYVRDNRSILEQLQGIAKALDILAFIVIAAVSITTTVIISHMIRQAIYQNKDHIYTLRLLGAPNRFIGFPYFLVGFMLTLIGGCLSSVSIAFLLREGYNRIGGILPFLPLPSLQEVAIWPVAGIMGLSIILGFVGSLLGLISANRERRT